MVWKEYREPREFQSDVFPFLLRAEAENCLFLGVVGTLVERPERFPTFRLLALESGSGVHGAAFMTPPYALGLSRLPDGALASLADRVSEWPERPSGLIGPFETAQTFLPLYLVRSGRAVSSTMRQRIYEVEKLVPPPPRPGAMRVVNDGDIDLLEKWNTGFIIDCKLTGDLPDARREAEACVRYGIRYLWEVDARPVSMAGFHGETPSGVRVSFVYTPPEERGKGWAAALVGALTAKLLERKRRCFLFTDLDNPVSNRLYAKLGYVPAGDFVHHTFRA